MQISLTTLNEYTDSLNELSESTKEIIRRLVSKIKFSDIGELREKLIEILEPVFAGSTEMAASYAADFYDTVRLYELGSKIGALAESGRNPSATEGYIRALVEKAISGGVEAVIPGLEGRADYEIKKAAGECVFRNGAKDRASVRFARVPTGVETCPFCIMLASRGFVYQNAKRAGSDGHYHANCDCRIVPAFTKAGTIIAGYDPDEYYQQYLDSLADGSLKLSGDKKRNKSEWKIETPSELPDFNDFNDVKSFVYEAGSQKDLEHRAGILSVIYGTHVLKRESLRNVFKTAEKKLPQ